MTTYNYDTHKSRNCFGTNYVQVPLHSHVVGDSDPRPPDTTVWNHLLCHRDFYTISAAELREQLQKHRQQAVIMSWPHCMHGNRVMVICWCLLVALYTGCLAVDH